MFGIDSHFNVIDIIKLTLLSLREIIREADQNTRVTLLEYLKQLHPIEWKNLVKDRMILAEESAMFSGVNPFATNWRSTCPSCHLRPAARSMLSSARLSI